MIDVFCICIGCILFSNQMHISFLKFTTRKCSLPCGVKFSRDLNFGDLDFRLYSFSRISCMVLDSNYKNGGPMLISLFTVFVFSNLPYVHLVIFVVFSLSLWS